MTVVVTEGNDEGSTEAAAEAVEAAAEAVEAAAEAVEATAAVESTEEAFQAASVDHSHSEHTDGIAAVGAAAAEALRRADEAHAIALATARYLVEEEQQPVEEEVTEVETIGSEEDTVTERKHNLLW